MGAHLGSFEALRAIGRDQQGLRVAMLMYEQNARKLNATLAAINPRAMQASIGFYSVIMHGESPLSRVQREMLATVVAAEVGCHY